MCQKRQCRLFWLGKRVLGLTAMQTLTVGGSSMLLYVYGIFCTTTSPDGHDIISRIYSRATGRYFFWQGSHQAGYC